MKRYLLLFAAVLCAPLWAQSTPDPLNAFVGKGGSFTDSLRGISATCPVGWTIGRAERWRDEETTIYLKAPQTLATQPSIYYQVFPVKPAPGLEGAKAYLQQQMQNKVTFRKKNGLTDYKVRPDSLVYRTVNGRPALSFMADFTQNGKKCAEYNTRVVGDTTFVLFFMMGNDWEVEALRPELDSMIETLRLP